MPLRRFSELFSELEKLKLSPGTTVFRVNPDSRSAKVFSGLYNICCEINISKEGSVQVNRISSVPNTPVGRVQKRLFTKVCSQLLKIF